MKLEPLIQELNLIQDKQIRVFTEHCLTKAPDYFWIKPSSSTGKYHPPQSNGDGGLVRHTKAMVYFANKLCDVYTAIGQEKDCIIAACILHDIVKYGVNGGEHTTKDHDAVGAAFIRSIAEDMLYSNNPIDMLLVEQICDGIEWHMGKWTKRMDGKVRRFPEDYTTIAKIVHLADVISAQNQVHLLHISELQPANFSFAPQAGTVSSEGVGDGTLRMPFGKHKGRVIEEIPSSYLRWMKAEMDKENLVEAADKELTYRDANDMHFED